jgi:hypothetical protein
MTAKTMLRVATRNTAHAVDVACSDMESAVGLRVRPAFQEIEGRNVIVEIMASIGLLTAFGRAVILWWQGDRRHVVWRWL